jgi:DUF971 family protein
MTEILATNVTIEKDFIQVHWNDGHRSPYPHRYLRLRCRCAQCVDEMTGKELIEEDGIDSTVTAIDHFTVGNYALQFLWSDTHHTGIYTFNFLRSICTCIECNEKPKA